MFDTPMDFKEQMAEARRKQILMGAAQVFAEKGYHKATTKEIAKAAGVAEGTIYNYFNNKRELLAAMLDLVTMQSLKDLMLDEPPEDLRALITAIMRDRAQLVRERGQLIVPVLAEVFNDVELRELLYRQVLVPMAAHMERYVQTHIDSGDFHPLDPVVVTRAIMGALMLNFALKFTGLESRYENISDEEMTEQLALLFVNGLLDNEK